MLSTLNDALHPLLPTQMEFPASATIASYGIRIAVRPVEFQHTEVGSVSNNTSAICPKRKQGVAVFYSVHQKFM